MGDRQSDKLSFPIISKEMFNNPGWSGGTYKIMVNDTVCIRNTSGQIRFPKSKKKRIRIKWSKKNKNYGLKIIHKSVMIDSVIYVSSKMYEEILKKIPLSYGR